MFTSRSFILNIRSIYSAFFRVYESSYTPSVELSPNRIFGESNRSLLSQRVISLKAASSNVMPLPPLTLEPNQVAGAILVPLCTISNEPALLLCLRPLHMRASPGELW